MLELSKQLLSKLEEVDQLLQNKYGSGNRNKVEIRQKLQSSVGAFRQMKKCSQIDLSKLLGEKLVAGVDGSVNQTKGSPPHVIYFFQALAKSVTGQECWLSDVYAPLLKEKRGDERSTSAIRSKILASLELQAAKKMIEDNDIQLMLMDGSLLHYRIDAPIEWKQLRALALEKNVFLVGVTEEVGTSYLIDQEIFSDLDQEQIWYDRDLLYGVLEHGEILYVDDAQHKSGLKTAWIRPSSSPAVTGIDVIAEQSEWIEDIANVVYTLTPKDGRGIPLWLDIVDRDVRLTDKLVEGLVDQYIDPEIKQRFLTPKRHERIY